MNDATRRPCQFTSSEPPRVLASAQFLRSVAEGWTPLNDNCDWWIRHYLATLSTWLQAQTDRDAGFVSIGALLVAAPKGSDTSPTAIHIAEGQESLTAHDGNGLDKLDTSACCGTLLGDPGNRINFALSDDDTTRCEHSGHHVITRVDTGGPKDKKLDCGVGRKMTALWLRSGSGCFGELTFRALALRLACVLTSSDWRLKNVLKGAVRACPYVRSLEGKELRDGALREIDVRNFPLMFNDVHAVADAKLRAQTCRAAKEDVRYAVDAEHGVVGKGLMTLAERFIGQRVLDRRCSELSAEAVRRALALGDHFCFRPRNPESHGADSVFFLRAANSRPEWVVLMLLRTQSPKERSDGATAADSTRRSTDLLFSVLEDTRGAQHSLKYVRVLVAASAVDACLPAGGR